MSALSLPHMPTTGTSRVSIDVGAVVCEHRVLTVIPDKISIEDIHTLGITRHYESQSKHSNDGDLAVLSMVSAVKPLFCKTFPGLDWRELLALG
jgi:hypothetical protein